MDRAKLVIDAVRAARAAAWEYVREGNRPAEHRWRFEATPELKALVGFSSDDLGTDPNEWVGHMSSDDVAEFSAQVGRCLQGLSDRLDVIFKVKHSDGHLMTVRATGCVERELDGHAKRLFGLTWDVTKYIADRERAELIARVFDASAGGLLICDAGRKIIEVNDAVYQITGWPEGAVKGRSLDRILFGSVESDVSKAAWVSIEEKGAWIGQVVVTKQDTRTFVAEVRLSAIRSSSGIITHYAALIFDIESLGAMGSVAGARRPDTSGVTSTHDLHQMLSVAINEAVNLRTGMALYVLGIDRLSSMFEMYGRQCVDQIMDACEDALRRAASPSAIIAHIHGDRFVVSIQDVMEEKEILQIFDRLQTALRSNITVDGKAYFLSASSGVAVFPLDGTTSDVLLQRAENALEEATRKGRGGANLETYKPSMSDYANDRIHLENNLRQALKLGAFECHLQPKVLLESGRWIGAEALMRWRIGDTWISPARFIPIAEESGLIKDMGRWILWEAASNIARWRQDGLIDENFRVAVNLAGAQLEPELIRTVRAVLSFNQIPSSALMLELTETIIVNDPKRAHFLLEELRKSGIRIALDDFGTGYTSMNQLLTLPVDEVKIDQSFVRGMPTDEASTAIVRSILTLAHGLKLDVIAEGVETEEQRVSLMDLGCKCGQGYLFAKALTPAAFEAALRAGKTH